MKIVQIAPVVEYRDSGSEDRGTWRRDPNTEATVYGLGDDGKLYYWGVTKSTRMIRTPEELDDDPELSASYYEKEYGWKPSN